MNLVVAAKALNQRAVQENWHHFCDPTLSFTGSDYETLLTLWRNKAAGRPMPARSEITARDLKDILRNIFICERVSTHPSRYRWRLVGTSLTSILGENTGKPVEETVPAEHLPRWIACGDMVLDGGQPMRFLGRVHINGRQYLDAENLLVPLSNDAGEPSFILAQCRYTPRRSDSEDIWENQLASLPGGLM